MQIVFIHLRARFEPEKKKLLITNKWMKGTLEKIRLGVCRTKKKHKQLFITREEANLPALCVDRPVKIMCTFCFQCQAYANLRMKYNVFDSATAQVSVKHISTILASKNETEIKTLAKYIRKLRVLGKRRLNKISN